MSVYVYFQKHSQEPYMVDMEKDGHGYEYINSQTEDLQGRVSDLFSLLSEPWPGM